MKRTAVAASLVGAAAAIGTMASPVSAQAAPTAPNATYGISICVAGQDWAQMQFPQRGGWSTHIYNPGQCSNYYYTAPQEVVDLKWHSPGGRTYTHRVVVRNVVRYYVP